MYRLVEAVEKGERRKSEKARLSLLSTLALPTVRAPDRRR